jgi:hypothetical protein
MDGKTALDLATGQNHADCISVLNKKKAARVTRRK